MTWLILNSFFVLCESAYITYRLISFPGITFDFCKILIAENIDRQHNFYFCVIPKT